MVLAVFFILRRGWIAVKYVFEVLMVHIIMFERVFARQITTDWIGNVSFVYQNRAIFLISLELATKSTFSMSY